jgi:type IV pilus assembly protein PilC
MLYTYRAVNKLGALSEGERDAQSEAELADILRRDGLILLEDHERNPHRGRFSFSLPTIGGGVSLVERLIFARNLAVMIGAGLPLTRALGALAEQTSSQRFKIILADAQSAITTGTTFADALRKHEKVFGQLFINMIEAGEVSGNLERTLKVLARQMKRDHDLRTKVRGALIYPAIVIAALILVGVLMMVFVVPTLSKTFEELKIPLPLTTQIVLGTSGFLISYYWAVLLILAVTAFGIWRTVQMPAARLYVF